MSWAEEWGSDEDYPAIVEKIVERRKNAVMQQRDKYEDSIRLNERERIIEVLKENYTNDEDDWAIDWAIDIVQKLGEAK